MPDSFQAEIAKQLQMMPVLLQPDVQRWLEHLAERQDGALEMLLDTQVALENVLRLVAVSEFAADQLLRHWEDFISAAEAGELARAPEPTWPGVGPEASEEVFKQQLRRLRNGTLLHILWRMLQGADLAESLKSLSELADLMIVASAEFARDALVSRFGEVRDADGQPVPLVILAMGKLGGGELNFSSDVDLIFLYSDDGDSDGPKAIAAQEYFARLSRHVVALLEESTADGFVYRVDTRLRPFGDSGPPVASFAALEAYLLHHGRSWERYAWIKSRVVAPEQPPAAVANLHRELIDPFVYRRYLDFGVFEALREMKAMVSAEVQRRDMADNIKLGPGGIREIEFIVQSLQLVRGGSVSGLRTRQLRSALRCLQDIGGLEPSAVEELTDAYAFLRRLENFLQAIRDQQVHDLPVTPVDRARLALAMGYPDWPALARKTAYWRKTVSDQFAAVAFRDKAETDGDELQTAVSALSEQGGGTESWQQLFEKFEFQSAGDLASSLSTFLSARTTREAGATAMRRLHRLLPVMLRELRDHAEQVATLDRLLVIVAQVLRRSAYVALLNENQTALSGLVNLCEKSAYLVDEVARYPVLLDELLDPASQQTPLSEAMFREELAERLAQMGDTDIERRIEVLAQFQRAMLFRIAAADFLSDLDVMKVSDRLTELAEIVLEQALDAAWRDLTQRFGEPRFVANGRLHAAGFGVIAYGKLGGIELSYGSDLDLVFLHNSRGENQCTDGAHALDNDVFFARLVRRLTHFLTIRTPSGALYEVDTRLRPSGRSGLLVSGVDAFERYQFESAWTWEHQALLRARPVAGDALIASEFERIRAATLTKTINCETLKQDVVEMREKMRAQLDQTDAEKFDLKQGVGGITDIEFLVQYLVLMNAKTHVDVMHYSDNIRQLESLGEAGCLSQDAVGELQDIYRRYRRRLHKLALNKQRPLAALDEFADERARVTSHWLHWLS